jgi:hypothetical protein
MLLLTLQDVLEQFARAVVSLLATQGDTAIQTSDRVALELGIHVRALRSSGTGTRAGWASRLLRDDGGAEL